MHEASKYICVYMFTTKATPSFVTHPNILKINDICDSNLVDGITDDT